MTPQINTQVSHCYEVNVSFTLKEGMLGAGGGGGRKGEGKAVRGAGWGEGGLKRRLAQIPHRLGKRGENP